MVICLPILQLGGGVLGEKRKERLEPGETKNRKRRNFSLTPTLREVLRAQIEQTEALNRAEGKIILDCFTAKANRFKAFAARGSRRA